MNDYIKGKMEGWDSERMNAVTAAIRTILTNVTSDLSKEWQQLCEINREDKEVYATIISISVIQNLIASMSVTVAAHKGILTEEKIKDTMRDMVMHIVECAPMVLDNVLTQLRNDGALVNYH